MQAQAVLRRNGSNAVLIANQLPDHLGLLRTPIAVIYLRLSEGRLVADSGGSQFFPKAADGKMAVR